MEAQLKVIITSISKSVYMNMDLKLRIKFIGPSEIQTATPLLLSLQSKDKKFKNEKIEPCQTKQHCVTFSVHFKKIYTYFKI